VVSTIIPKANTIQTGSKKYFSTIYFKEFVSNDNNLLKKGVKKMDNNVRDIPAQNNKDGLTDFNLPEELMFDCLIESNRPNETMEGLLAFVERIKKPLDNLYIMPAGNIALILYRYLNTLGLSNIGFIDNYKYNQYLCDQKIISIDDLKQGSTVIVATQSFTIRNEISLQLKNKAINSIVINVPDCLWIWMLTQNRTDLNFRDLIKEDFKKLNHLYNLLYDATSKQTLIALLNFRLSFNESYTAPILSIEKNKYFEPSIYQVTSDDCFVDCGAFVGDTFEELISKTNGKIKGYYGFEPSNESFKTAYKIIKKYKNTTIYPIGIFSCKRTAFFDTDLLSTMRCIDDKNGSVTISVDTLDNVLNGRKITYIKMDIQGTEIEALKGAKNIIKEQKPVLVISAYHKFDDLWEIPLLIDSFGVSYNYYLRHYASDDTILYCVAK
jgi:FkbM family methyltransferase